jgi:hypothetical protein
LKKKKRRKPDLKKPQDLSKKPILSMGGNENFLYF